MQKEGTAPAWDSSPARTDEERRGSRDQRRLRTQPEEQMEAKSPASWMQDPGRLNSLVLE
jgi:hypothetical protein